MMRIQANFIGGAALAGSLASAPVATLPDRLKAFAGRHRVQTFLDKEPARSAKAEQGGDAIARSVRSAGAVSDRRSNAGAVETRFVTRRENAVRALTAHAGPYPWQPVLALALGIAFASLAIGVAADLGAGAAARPHYAGVAALPG
jgi:hypothetical protein